MPIKSTPLMSPKKIRFPVDMAISPSLERNRRADLAHIPIAHTGPERFESTDHLPVSGSDVIWLSHIAVTEPRSRGIWPGPEAPGAQGTGVTDSP